MPSHRARGFGRYLALRTAVPRHAAGRPAGSRRLPPLLVLAGLLSTVSAGVIVLRLEQTGGTPRASVPPPRITAPPPGTRLPPPYRFKWSTARAVRQAAKARPVLLGRAGPEALDRGWRCPPGAP